MKPRALALMSRLPWPLDDGGRIALHQDAVSVARCADTVAVVFVPPGEVEAPLPRELADLGIRFARVPHRPPPTLSAIVAGMASAWPHTLARYRSSEFERTVRREVGQFRPDFVYFSSLHMATYSGACGGLPLVLRQQNLEHLFLSRLAPTLANPLARAYASYQAARMKGVESRLCGRMDLVLAIHEPEAAELRRLAPGTRIEVIPVGVDPARFEARAPASPPAVLITGAFGWAPNLHGLRRFLQEGWPELRRLAPGARLRIVGRDLPKAGPMAAAGERVELVGYVNRIEPEFAHAALLLVPLWSGAGARVKIVEALMAGTPVVSTPLGAEGLGLAAGREIVLAESPQELAGAAAALLADPARATALAEAGRTFAQAHFSLETIARRTCELCASVLESARARTAESA